MSKHGSVIGPTGIYVDNCLNNGTEQFRDATNPTFKRFNSNLCKNKDFKFYGAGFSTTGDVHFIVSANHSISRLKPTPFDVSFQNFQHYRALLPWITHTPPDIACIANRTSQVTEVRFGAQDIRELNKGIKMARSEAEVGLRYMNIDRGSIHPRVYSDASFANNEDCLSQLEYILVLLNNTKNCHISDSAIKKSKCVVRSIMAGETLEFMNAFDAVYAIGGDMERTFEVFLEVRMYTDPRKPFYALTREMQTSERRLAVNISTARGAYRDQKIARTGLANGHDDPDAAMSKVIGNHQFENMRSGTDNKPVENG